MQDPTFAAALRWGLAFEESLAGKITSFWGGQFMKDVRDTYHAVFNEAEDGLPKVPIMVAAFVDGFNPFNSGTHSTWAIILQILNPRSSRNMTTCSYGGWWILAQACSYDRCLVRDMKSRVERADVGKKRCNSGIGMSPGGNREIGIFTRHTGSAGEHFLQNDFLHGKWFSN